MGRMEDVERHFEDEAREFDDIIRRLIPYYPIKEGRRNEFDI